MSAHLDSILRALSITEAQIASATEQRDNLRQQLLDELSRMESDRYVGAFAKVTVCMRRTYSYSHNVTTLTEQLKAEKKIEEKTGIAQVDNITFYPRITWTE